MGSLVAWRKKLYRAEGSKTIGFFFCSQCVLIKFSQCTYQVPNGSQVLPTCYVCSQCVLQHVPNMFFNMFPMCSSACSQFSSSSHNAPIKFQMGPKYSQHVTYVPNVFFNMFPICKTYTFLCLSLEWIQYWGVSKVSELFLWWADQIYAHLPKQGVCHTVTLPFTFKSILRQKKNYGNSSISPCKKIIFQKSTKMKPKTLEILKTP